jgi:hypothetical protein
MRWIVLSDPYALSSRMPKGTTDDPLAGKAPLFSYFYSRQMRAEELYESLVIATQSQRTGGSYHEQERLKGQWLAQFAMAFGTDENNEATTYDGTIAQTLMMWNGPLVAEATGGKQGTYLHQVASANDKNVAKVQRLFVAALGRPATPAELRMIDEHWRRRRGDSLAAMQDLWWVLLNSGEFILNH